MISIKFGCWVSATHVATSKAILITNGLVTQPHPSCTRRPSSDTAVPGRRNRRGSLGSRRARRLAHTCHKDMFRTFPRARWVPVWGDMVRRWERRH